MTARAADALDDAVAVAEPPAVPGLRFRRYHGLADIPGMAAVADAVTHAAGSADNRTAESMLATYAHLSNCDPDLDILLAEVDGRTVGYHRTWWADRNDGPLAYEGIEFVHPDVAERGIEDAFLALGLGRQLELADRMAADHPGRERILVRYARTSEGGADGRLRGAGFQPVRRWAEMHRYDLGSVPEIPVPEGIDLRGADLADPDLLRKVFEFGREVFRDHFGEADPTEEDWAQFQVSPETQPHLWVLAHDASSGELVGHILNYLGAPEPDGTVVGWTESIAVRASHRRRGLASAMLAESLRIVRSAGATRAALGVDQQNPNRAMSLYERLGFRMAVEDIEYHRPIEAEARP